MLPLQTLLQQHKEVLSQTFCVSFAAPMQQQAKRWTVKSPYDKMLIKLLEFHMQEQKKKELEELNAMLAEMGVAPKEAEADAGGTATSGKKKKKKDKAAVKENAATAVNGNGVAPSEQPKAEQPSSEQTQESIEVCIALFANLPNSLCMLAVAAVLQHHKCAHGMCY